MIYDPREGRPSASSFGLDALCHGRPALLQTMPDVPEIVDEDADRGTILHAAWEKEDMTNLPPKDLEIYDRGLKLVTEAVNSWKERFSIDLVSEGPREQRFWLLGPHGERLASGQADRHWFSPEYALVLDFKSLWCRSLVPSELNWQLLLLAVLIAQTTGVNHVRAVFAKAMLGQLDIVDFNAKDLARAEYAIEQVLWASKHTPDRRPGPHCRHCKAAVVCAEAKAYVLLPSVQARALQGITPTTARAIVDDLDLKDCVRIWETQTSRRNIEDAIKARLKALPAPLQAELGIKLGKPTVNRPITAPREAFNFLLSVGIPLEELWSTASIDNGELADVVQKCLGLSSQKAAVAWIREKLSPFITEKPQEAPLEQL